MQPSGYLKYPIKALEGLGVALVGGIVLVVTGSVLLRLFGKVPAGATELATLLFVWAVYIGAILAFLEGGHLAITALVNRLKGRVETAVSVISDSLLLLFLVIVTLESFKYIELALNSPRLTASLKISPAWQRGALVVGMGLAAIYILVRILINLRQLVRGGPTMMLHTRTDDDLQEA